MNSKSPKLLVAAAAITLVGAGAAIAAGSSSSSAGAGEPFLSAVAKRVNVAPDALLAAMKAEAKERVDAAAKDGRLPAETAARIKERIDEATLEHPSGLLGKGPHGSRGGPRHHRGPRETGRVAADYLGLTRPELRAELAKGRSLAQIAKEQGKSADGLKDAILAKVKSKLDKAVADKRLTQAHAERLYDHLKARIDDLVNRTPHVRPAFGPDDRFGANLRGDGRRNRRFRGRMFGAHPMAPPILPPLGAPAGG